NPAVVDTGSNRCRQAEEGLLACPGTPDAVDRYRRHDRPSKQAAVPDGPGQGKNSGLGGVRSEAEAMEEDYRSASKRLYSGASNRPAPQKGEAVLCQHCLQHSGECQTGELLTSTGDIVGRWKKYFEELLNPTDLPSSEEAEAGDSEVDSITQAEVTEYLWSRQTGVVVPLFKKGDRRVCSNYRGITLLSLPGKVYARVLERRIQADSRTLGFRRNNVVFVPAVEHWTISIPSAGCLRVYGSLPNQSTCALRIWRRHSTVSLVVFCGECSVEYGVRGPLLRAVGSLYDRSRSLVCSASSKSDLFPVLEPVFNVGLRQA
ncbi:hypothetical protein L3Q82_014517, partial [Scortum barcoo]